MTKVDIPHKAVMDEMLLPIPGVTGGNSFGHLSYRFGKKIFCWIGENGVFIKLPVARIADILASDPQSEQNHWREWIRLWRDDPEDYHDLRGLFDESIRFVTGG
jgi:hypothetical protein